DLSGLLTRAGHAAPAPRYVLPDTRTAVPRRGFRGPAVRYGLTAAAGALAALLAAAPFLGAGRGPTPEGETDPPGNGPADARLVKSREAEEPKEPEGVRLTYGPYGPPRPDHRVLPGEVVYLDLLTHGAGKNSKGEVDYSVAGELVDHTGEKKMELAPV